MNDDYIPLMDHLGNVTGLHQLSYDNLTLQGTLEYDAFGREVRSTGSACDKVPFHFSTKFTDPETGLNYYGYRFYDPNNGRWLNRDPIGEMGGVNLYGMVGNDPVNASDVLGLAASVISNATDLPTGDQDQSHTSAGDLLLKLKMKSTGRCDCLKRLDINGHGNPYGMYLGPMNSAAGTLNPPQSNGADGDNWLSDSNVEWFANQLKEMMCKPCTIYLSGCNTGNLKGADAWFKRLGRITGCKIVTNAGYSYGNISGNYRAVEASAGPQYPPYPDDASTRPSKNSTIYRYDPVKDKMYGEVIAPPVSGMP